jgi:hypothetical protein
MFTLFPSYCPKRHALVRIPLRLETPILNSQPPALAISLPLLVDGLSSLTMHDPTQDYLQKMQKMHLLKDARL